MKSLLVVLLFAVSVPVAISAPASTPSVTGSARNDAPAIREKIRQAVEAGQGVVHLPAGEYLLQESVELPSSLELRGEGIAATRLLVPAGAAFDAIVLRNVQHTAIRDLSLHSQSEPYTPRLGGGIVVEGDCRYLRFENVAVYGFRSGFSFGREEGSRISRSLLRRCHAEKASFFGFEFNNIKVLALDHCYAFRNRLDGIKFRRHVVDVTVRGGESSYNGAADPAVNGNGIDGYAGADSVAVYDMVAEGNNGSGFYFKTGPLTLKGFGKVQNLFFSGVRARGNRGSGIDINRSGGDTIKKGETELPPLVSHVTIVGGVFEENQASGIYLRARDVTVMGAMIRRNRQNGITVSSSWNVNIIAPLISGNGNPEAPERHSGIVVGGALGSHRVSIRGGVIDGVDNPMASDGNDQPAVPSCNRNLISVSEKSDHVSIQHVSLRNAGDPANPVRSRIPGDRGFEWVPLP